MLIHEEVHLKKQLCETAQHERAAGEAMKTPPTRQQPSAQLMNTEAVVSQHNSLIFWFSQLCVISLLQGKKNLIHFCTPGF